MQRNESLDALRGFAILMMILSGTISFSDVMPAWMFHAQVPPPQFKFDPSIPGITWVDLVFPFFLFSMGAAIPLSLQKHLNANKGLIFILQIALKRFLLLAFFALFTQHMKAWVIAEPPTVIEQLLSLLAFVLLFFQFYENKSEKHKTLFLAIKILAFAIALLLLWKLPFHGGKGFDFYKSDIIILVLANMALFGILIYYLTARKPLLRIGVLPFVMAVFLAGKEPMDGWAKALFNFDAIGDWKFDWLYKFYFLKYLFIIIPGTLAGEWLIESMKGKNQQHEIPNTSDAQAIAGASRANWLMLIALVLLYGNLYGLFTRQLFANLLLSAILCAIAWFLVRAFERESLSRRFVMAGSYMLLLGLFFEAYEGGIKKDTSTYSYYFVCSGLAFFCLIAFNGFLKLNHLSSVANYLALNGKNPMVAYVVGNLLLLPILSLTQLKPFWDGMNQNILMGLMKGLVFTGVVSLITIFFVKRKWFWKT
jgi:predicted acyltransferase